MVPVFIGTAPEHFEAERALENSIKANSPTASISWMRKGDPGWDFIDRGPTGFTMFRFCVPELMGFEGQAIYLDVDMLVLADLEQLLAYGEPGKWVCHNSEDTDCVSVIDCSCVRQLPSWPSIDEMAQGQLRKWHTRAFLEPVIVRSIPDEWNSRDRLTPGTKLLHFSDLSTQPWKPALGVNYQEHPDRAAVSLWRKYAA